MPDLECLGIRSNNMDKKGGARPIGVVLIGPGAGFLPWYFTDPPSLARARGPPRSRGLCLAEVRQNQAKSKSGDIEDYIGFPSGYPLAI